MKNYLRIDQLLQSILFVPYAVCGILGVFGGIIESDLGGILIYYMILHFIIGIYQLSSGVIGGLVYGEKRRKQYLLMNIVYFTLAFLGSLLIDGFGHQWSTFLGAFYIFVLPSVIATWYYYHTLTEAQETQQEYV